ncbi:integrase [Patescibacteria group bacterium]|nr:integrase [Patescibacteria group bacterium]
MDDSRISDVSELREFLKGLGKVQIELIDDIFEKYTLIEKTVKKFKYHKLEKHDKKTVLIYLRRLTGYHKAQLLRLVKRVLSGEHLEKTVYVRHNSRCVYTPKDIKLLEYTDAVHHRLNALATKKILERQVALFGELEYSHIAKVSSSHINNLRKSNEYRTLWVNGTKAKVAAIGKTKEPEPNGTPGSIRVDTVHQRGIYYLHGVCEVTQWDVLIAVPMLSERYLEPALKLLLSLFPFVVFNFHSDRGSEFINKIVACLLNKLLIEQTKSRSRHSNDNALIESKNGSIIRKNFGYEHLQQNQVDDINLFLVEYFIPYLNYHRPCLYLTNTKKNKRGHETRIYGEANTPYEKLKEIDKTLKTSCLKPSLSFPYLDTIAYQCSDNEWAKIMRQQEHKAFDEVTAIIEQKKG